MTEQTLFENFANANGLIRDRKANWHVLFFQSRSDQDSSPSSMEVYDPNMRDAGRHMEVGILLVDALLNIAAAPYTPRYGVTPMVYSKFGFGEFHIPVEGRYTNDVGHEAVALNRDALRSAAEFASIIRFDCSKLHVRYARDDWRTNPSSIIEMPTGFSAKADLLRLAAMIETLCIYLGSVFPIPPYNQMQPGKTYEFYKAIPSRLIELVVGNASTNTSTLVSPATPSSSPLVISPELRGLIAKLIDERIEQRLMELLVR